MLGRLRSACTCTLNAEADQLPDEVPHPASFSVPPAPRNGPPKGLPAARDEAKDEKKKDLFNRLKDKYYN